MSKKARNYPTRGWVDAQHRTGGVYRRADWRGRLQRSRSSESPVTLGRNTHLGFILRSPGFLASDLGILHQICPEFELIHIVRPLLHQLPPFFQQIAAPVGRLDLIADGVRQRHLNDL